MSISIIIIYGYIFGNIFYNRITCEIASPMIKVCQSQKLLIGSERNAAKIVDVGIGSTVTLECNFW